MKIGNLSQSIVRTPHFFINQSHKKEDINTFRIPKKSFRRIFREKDYITCPLLSSLNYNRNKRHYIISDNNTFRPENFLVPLTQSSSKVNFSKRLSCEIIQPTDFMKSTSLSKISKEEFHNTMQTNVTNILNKINRDTMNNNEMTERTDGLFITNKFPKTMTFRYLNKENEFRQTLNQKIKSLKLITPEVKQQISLRYKSFRGLKQYEQSISKTPSFQETVRSYLNM